MSVASEVYYDPVMDSIRKSDFLKDQTSPTTSPALSQNLGQKLFHFKDQFKLDKPVKVQTTSSFSSASSTKSTRSTSSFSSSSDEDEKSSSAQKGYDNYVAYFKQWHLKKRSTSGCSSNGLVNLISKQDNPWEILPVTAHRVGNYLMHVRHLEDLIRRRDEALLLVEGDNTDHTNGAEDQSCSALTKNERNLSSSPLFFSNDIARKNMSSDASTSSDTLSLSTVDVDDSQSVGSRSSSKNVAVPPMFAFDISGENENDESSKRIREAHQKEVQENLKLLQQEVESCQASCEELFEVSFSMVTQIKSMLPSNEPLYRKVMPVKHQYCGYLSDESKDESILSSPSSVEEVESDQPSSMTIDQLVDRLSTDLELFRWVHADLKLSVSCPKVTCADRNRNQSKASKNSPPTPHAKNILQNMFPNKFVHTPLKSSGEELHSYNSIQRKSLTAKSAPSATREEAQGNPQDLHAEECVSRKDKGGGPHNTQEPRESPLENFLSNSQKMMANASSSLAKVGSLSPFGFWSPRSSDFVCWLSICHKSSNRFLSCADGEVCLVSNFDVDNCLFGLYTRPINYTRQQRLEENKLRRDRSNVVNAWRNGGSNDWALADIRNNHHMDSIRTDNSKELAQRLASDVETSSVVGFFHRSSGKWLGKKSIGFTTSIACQNESFGRGAEWQINSDRINTTIFNIDANRGNGGWVEVEQVDSSSFCLPITGKMIEKKKSKELTIGGCEAWQVAALWVLEELKDLSHKIR